MVTGPYQITEDDVERSSTLEPKDIGLWCLIINGSYQFFESYVRAQELKRHLQE